MYMHVYIYVDAYVIINVYASSSIGFAHYMGLIMAFPRDVDVY
jgi:hypothetical protein